MEIISTSNDITNPSPPSAEKAFSEQEETSPSPAPADLMTSTPQESTSDVSATTSGTNIAEKDASEESISTQPSEDKTKDSPEHKSEELEKEPSDLNKNEECTDPDTPKIPKASECKTAEEVEQYLRDRIEAIRSQENFHNKIVLSNLKGINRIYFDKKKFKKTAQNTLVECKFAG